MEIASRQLVELGKRLRTPVERALAGRRSALISDGDQSRPLGGAGACPINLDPAAIAGRIVNPKRRTTRSVVGDVRNRPSRDALSDNAALIACLGFVRADAAAAAAPTGFA